MKIFKVIPNHWKKGSYLKIQTNNMNFNDVGLLLNIGKIPSFSSYLCSFDFCPLAKKQGSELYLNYEEWSKLSTSNPLQIVIFPKVENFKAFTITFIIESNSTNRS